MHSPPCTFAPADLRRSLTDLLEAGCHWGLFLTVCGPPHKHTVLSDPFHPTECVRDCKILLWGRIHHPVLLLQQTCADCYSPPWSRTSLRSPPYSLWSFIPTRSCLTHSTLQNVLEMTTFHPENAFTTLCFCSSRPAQIATHLLEAGRHWGFLLPVRGPPNP